MDPASYRTVFTIPPPIKEPYKPEEALDDLPGIRYAVDQFFASHMHESEDYCNQNDPNKERLYLAAGYGLIQCVKGLMSFSDKDLLDAMKHAKQGNLVAQRHRKPQPYLVSRVAGYVVPGMNTGVAFVRTMTSLERHAELIYAESLFAKALLGIVYSGDWLAFVKEALNMRNVFNIYQDLYKYICEVDAKHATELGVKPDQSSRWGPESPALDRHFRSGVYLGAGMSRLLISLLPARIRNIIVMLGYPADRAEALEIVYRAGGWGRASTLHPDKDRRAYEVTPPAVSSEDEGMRRTLCDMALLIFHLVLSTWTFDGVDVPMAARIVTWNLHRYPSGVFPLLGAGRLALMRSRPDEAIEHYTRAMEVQTQYRNLHHVSLWEIAIAHLALGDPARSLGYWRQLEKEATWSKAIYTYGMAVCLLASSEGEESARLEEAKRLMEKVPTLRQKIAGKSIPVEKFVARKARKFISQNRLALPALEISYTFAAIAHAPRRVLETRMLPEVHKVVAYLTANPGSTGYWDDYCLARFLEGVCLRFLAFPDPDALLDPADSASATISRDDASAGSKAAFEAVFEHGPKIELDHHLVYYAHYEYGRLMACLDDEAEAKRQFELVLSGNHLEVGPSGRKGRYSLANALQMRTNAALDALHQKRL